MIYRPAMYHRSNCPYFLNGKENKIQEIYWKFWNQFRCRGKRVKSWNNAAGWIWPRFEILFVSLHTANVHFLSLKLGEQNIRLMLAANISDIQEIYHRVATALFALTIAVAFAQFPWLIKEVFFILSSGILMSWIKCPLHQQKLNAFIANKKYRACYPTVLKVKSRSLVS